MIKGHDGRKRPTPTEHGKCLGYNQKFPSLFLKSCGLDARVFEFEAEGVSGAHALRMLKRFLPAP